METKKEFKTGARDGGLLLNDGGYPQHPDKNQYSGFDPLMVCGDGMMMRTLKRCYRKHVRGDDDIGWDELSSELGNTLAQVMGDDEFCKWLEGLD